MKNVCLLITTEYPFSYGEPFLESEIEFLSNGFDEVHICPIHYSNNNVRSVPKNVFIHPLKIRKKIILKYLFYGLIHHEHKSIRGFKNKVFATYYSGKSYCIFKKMKKILEDIFIDTSVVIYSYWLNYVCRAGIYYKQFLESQNISNIKIVSRGHRYDIYKETNSFKCLPLLENNIKNVDSVFICSKNGSDYLKKEYPELKNKIRTSYLGVVPQNVKSSSIDSKTFLTVSWFNKNKRMSLFAEAFASIHHLLPEWKWVAIGGFGDDYERAKQIIVDNNLSAYVTFKGSISHSEVLDFYKNNEVSYLVNVSASEGLPVSMMEAESFGVPIIATAVGGVPEIVDESTGFLISGDTSSKEVAEILLDAASISPEMYSIKCNGSKEKWSVCFDSSKNYKKWVEYLLSK